MRPQGTEKRAIHQGSAGSSMISRSAAAGALAFAGLLTTAAMPASASASTGPANHDAAAPFSESRACGSGVTVTALIPAPGFDPLTATPDQLLANNLPLRPTDPSQLRTWTKLVTTLKPQLSCDFRILPRDKTASHAQLSGPLASYGCPPSCDSPNWDGNVATGYTYSMAYGAWNIPQVTVPANGNGTFSSDWVGIGQGYSDGEPLIQGGSESNSTGSLSTYYLWVEEYPEQSQMVVAPALGPGQTVDIKVQFNPGQASVTVIDLVDHFDQTYSWSGNITPDGTAEWIYERTAVQGSYPELADAAPSFSQAQAGDGSFFTGVGNLPHYWRTMWNCTSASDTELAEPGPITNNGTEFGTTWLNYGTLTSDSCNSW